MEVAQLARMMGGVAGDQCFLTLRADADAIMAGRMAARRDQIDLVADLVISVHQIDQAGIDDRLNRIREGLVLDHVPAVRGEQILALAPIFELVPFEQIAGVGEGRHPLAVDQHRVPADMIDMEMGAEHDIEAFAREARAFEVLEEGGLEVRHHLHCALLVIADAGVDHDPLRRRVDDERVHAHDDVAGVGDVIGLEPFDLEHLGAGGTGESVFGRRGHHHLDDLGDGAVADLPRLQRSAALERFGRSASGARSFGHILSHRPSPVPGRAPARRIVALPIVSTELPRSPNS